jgi:hypothetical protein
MQRTRASRSRKHWHRILFSVSQTDLGQCFSELTGLPYVPLMPRPPSEVALQLISPQCAARWEIFPVGYDAREDVLSFAIHDPDQQSKVEALYRFFMQPHALEFSIAPDVEIARACRRHLGFFGGEDAAAAAPRLDATQLRQSPRTTASLRK